MNLINQFNMKTFLKVGGTAAIPFLLVWAAFILTGFAFNPQQIFTNGSFWGVSVIYWFLWVCLIPIVIEN